MAFKRLLRGCQCCFLWLWLGCAAPQPATAPSITSVASPVSYQHIVRRNPNLSILVVQINLGDPRVAVHVSRGGPAPDGPGPWVTTLLPASEIAAREHYDIAINGDFFAARSTHDIEGWGTGYVKGKFAAPSGMAMTAGQLWHKGTRPYLEITAGHVARVIDGGVTDAVDPAAREIIGGGQVIVRDGKAVPCTGSLATARHPRTVVGVDKSGTQLTLLVVDGRQPKLSIGMTLAELSTEMLALGCAGALNLDGGGSSTLVVRDAATHQLIVRNSPSDGKERAVADVLGVTVNGPLPEVK